ncbi:MAG TPA: hypothetical protein DCQ06_09690 [Myxococcales bacterium]|nr:hypothetical protein [Myxococcales bacterium]HAN31856.1 hypothetical protein [Myxococcales bacterium]|tara:strand:+ start:1298 stop:2461 length:1164 start_codon:yes stop_codon:yes gene_type:complete
MRPVGLIVYVLIGSVLLAVSTGCTRLPASDEIVYDASLLLNLTDAATEADTATPADTLSADAGATDVVAKDTKVTDTKVTDTKVADTTKADTAEADTAKPDTTPTDTDLNIPVKFLNMPEDKLYPSCTAEYANNKHKISGAVFIDPDGSGGNAKYAVYCQLDTSGLVWTLVLKVHPEDAQFEFQYDKATEKTVWSITRNQAGAQINHNIPNLSPDKSARYMSYYDMKVKYLRLQFAINGKLKQPIDYQLDLKKPTSALFWDDFTETSLVFGPPFAPLPKDNQTHLNVWMLSVIPGSDLQTDVMSFGTNSHIGVPGGFVSGNPLGVRIGWVGDDNQGTADSWMGIGGTPQNCGADLPKKIYSGVRSCYTGKFKNLNIQIPATGYIFVR